MFPYQFCICINDTFQVCPIKSWFCISNKFVHISFGTNHFMEFTLIYYCMIIQCSLLRNTKLICWLCLKNLIWFSTNKGWCVCEKSLKLSSVCFDTNQLNSLKHAHKSSLCWSYLKNSTWFTTKCMVVPPVCLNEKAPNLHRHYFKTNQHNSLKINTQMTTLMVVS